MATLREQAREKAKALWTPGWAYRAEVTADAASDAWEPIVEQMVAALRNSKRRLEYFGKSTHEIDGALAEWEKANG